MKDSTSVFTYILYNKYNYKYYCGKTTNLNNRIKQHSNDNYKYYKLIWYYNDDIEKKIKSFGVKRFMNSVLNGNEVLS